MLKIQYFKNFNKDWF